MTRYRFTGRFRARLASTPMTAAKNGVRSLLAGWLVVAGGLAFAGGLAGSAGVARADWPSYMNGRDRVGASDERLPRELMLPSNGDLKTRRASSCP